MIHLPPLPPTSVTLPPPPLVLLRNRVLLEQVDGSYLARYSSAADLDRHSNQRSVEEILRLVERKPVEVAFQTMSVDFGEEGFGR